MNGRNRIYYFPKRILKTKNSRELKSTSPYGEIDLVKQFALRFNKIRSFNRLDESTEMYI